MFIILKNDTASKQQKIIAMTDTMENASKKMLEYAASSGADINKFDDHNDEGIFVTRNADGSIIQYKNTIVLTPGYVYGVTREVKLEQIATYVALDIPAEVCKQFEEMYSSKPAAFSLDNYLKYKDAMVKLINISPFVNKLTETTGQVCVDEIIKKRYMELKDTDDMSVKESIDIGKLVEDLSPIENDHLLEWCMQNQNSHHITNLIGFMHYRRRNHNEALKYVIEAAENGNTIAFLNLQNWHEYKTAGKIAVKLVKEELEKVQDGPMTREAEHSITKRLNMISYSERIENELTEWCNGKLDGDKCGAITHMRGYLAERCAAFVGAKAYYQKAVDLGSSYSNDRLERMKKKVTEVTNNE